MTVKPCLKCGTLARNASYCGTHTREKRKTERSRSYSRENSTYNHRWRKLSKTMRARQPFCSYVDADGYTCGATDDLTLDHVGPEAYARQAAGLPLGTEYTEVLCRSHNSTRGRQRG